MAGSRPSSQRSRNPAPSATVMVPGRSLRRCWRVVVEPEDGRAALDVEGQQVADDVDGRGRGPGGARSGTDGDQDGEES